MQAVRALAQRKSVVCVSSFGGKLDLFARLRQKLLRPSRMSAQIVAIIFLRFVNFMPRLLNELLRRSHVSVSLTHGHSRSLRK